jgi:hypothetical protein
MTPQEEIDIYLGKTTVGDKTIVDIYLNKPLQEPTPNNDNVTQANDDQSSSTWKNIIPDLKNVNPGDIRPQVPDEKLTNPNKATNNEQGAKNSVTSKTKTYKKHFYITLGIACILLLALILKK